MKILIVEDLESQWEFIKNMLQAAKNDYIYSPVLPNEHKEFNKKLLQSFSKDKITKQNAKKYIDNIIKQNDILLLDYELGDIDLVNAIQFYKRYCGNKKALIYTKFTGRDLRQIYEDVASLDSSENIDVMSKPINFEEGHQLNENIEELDNRIQKLIYGSPDNIFPPNTDL